MESKEIMLKILKNKNITTYKLSKISKVPKTTLVDLVNGKTSLFNASIKTLKKLSSAIGYSVEDLLNGNIYENNDEVEEIPKCLSEYVEKMKLAWQKKDNNETYDMWDCDFCELQSEINVAEIEGVISNEFAWYLREKYLRITRS